MFLALLLALPTFTAPPTQDPGFDPRYWEALHLIEVKGKPVQAAELLIVLAEDPSRPKGHEQHAMVLAQASRALSLAGRTDEADRFMSEARQIAANQPFEDRVDQVLQQAAAARPAGDLDPDFLRLIVEQLQEDDYRTLRRYGRRILPYALHLLQAPGFPGLEREPGLALTERAFDVALPVADEGFARALQARTKSLTGPELRSVFGEVPGKVQPADAEAEAALDGLLLAWSEEDSVSRARTAVEWIVQQLGKRRSAVLEQRLVRIVRSPDNLLGPFAVEHLNLGQVGQELALAAATSPQPMVAQLARERLAAVGAIETLALLGEHATVENRMAMAAMLVRRSGTMAIRATGNPQLSLGSVSAAFDELLGTPYCEGLTRRSFRSPKGLDDETALRLLAPLLRDSSPAVRAVATLAAVGRGEFGPVTRALTERDPHLLQPLLLALPQGYPQELDPLLVTLVDGSETGRRAAFQLADHAWRLTPEQLRAVDESWGTEERSSIGRGLQAWSSTEQGRRELLAWMDDDSRTDATRFAAFDALLETDPALAGAGISLMDLGSDYRDHVYARLAEKWAWAIAFQAVQAGKLAPAEASRFVELWRAAKDPSEGKSGFGQALHRLFGAEVEGNLALLEALVQTPEDAERFLSTVWVPHGSPVAAPVLEHLIAVASSSSWRDQGADRWLRQNERSPHDHEVVRVMLGSPVPELHREALRILATSDLRAGDLAPLVARFLSNPRVAYLAALALTEEETEADHVPALLGGWSMAGLAVRRSYLEALGRTQDDRVVPVLLDALADRDSQVATAASAALARIKKVREERQSWEAWQLYGAGGSPVAALMKKATSGPPHVRIAAIQSLGTLKAKEALPLLVELLERPNPKIATAAQEAIAKINQ